MSAAEVAETYGDRIRHAPAVVNAGRPKSNRQAARAAVAGSAAQVGGFAAGNTGGGRASTRQGGASTMLGATAGINDDASSSNGGATATKGEGATADNVDGSAPATVASGSGGGVAVDGVAVAPSAGTGTGTGLYQPRTSTSGRGRTVGGSLGVRFNDGQVGAVRAFPPTIAQRSWWGYGARSSSGLVASAMHALLCSLYRPCLLKPRTHARTSRLRQCSKAIIRSLARRRPALVPEKHVVYVCSSEISRAVHLRDVRRIGRSYACAVYHPTMFVLSLGRSRGAFERPGPSFAGSATTLCRRCNLRRVSRMQLLQIIFLGHLGKQALVVR